MYAVIEVGGKQYRIKEGDVVRVEKLDGCVGEMIEVLDVLLVSTDDGIKVGNPRVEGARVVAQIVEQGRAKKIIVFKKKRRKGYRRKRGHRQYYTGLKIKEIIV